MDEVILFSTGCPRCQVLKSKLSAIGVNYRVETSVDEMTKLGLTEVPALMVNGKLLGFMDAVRWANQQ